MFTISAKSKSISYFSFPFSSSLFSFNFKADVSDEFAEKIYQKMKNKKWFVEEGNKIAWP